MVEEANLAGPPSPPPLRSGRLQLATMARSAELTLDASWLTLRDAIQEADDLLERAKGPDLEFIREHRDALQQRLAEAMRLVAGERLDV
jgi:hypothetical protein